MRRIQKKIITMLDLCDKDTCAFLCEEVQFFLLTKDKFQNFLSKLTY